MASGVDAVTAEIRHEFKVGQIDEGDNFNTKGAVLTFSSEGRRFVVNVTYEFDQDYASGQIRINLSNLGKILRMSKSGEATVTRHGISPQS